MSILAWIESLVLRIYQLPMGVLVQYAVFAVLIVRALYRKISDRWWLRPSLGALLAVWFLSVLWTTVFSRSVGAHDVRWIPLYTYWSVLHGGNRELLRSCFMNGLLFFPAGLLWTGLLPKDRSWKAGLLRTVLCFVLISITIELLQYHLQLGNAEVDDVLHNTLGAAFGFAACRIKWGGPQRSKETPRADPSERSGSIPL